MITTPRAGGRRAQFACAGWCWGWGERLPGGFARVLRVASEGSVRRPSAQVSAPPPPPAFRFVSRPGPAGSESETVEQSPPQSPGPGKAGDAPNRRSGHVRGARVLSPPGRRARLSSPGPSSSSEAREELRRRLRGLIERSRVIIFSKSYCPHSTRVGAALAGSTARDRARHADATPGRAGQGWGARLTPGLRQ